MTQSQALTLKDIFYRIKQFYFGVSDKPLSAADLTAGDASEYLALLKQARSACFAPEEGAKLPADADEMLGAVVDEVLAALCDKNFRFAGDLAALGVRLLGVYSFPNMSRARFWRTCMLPLRDKHGDGLFAAQEERFLSGKSTALRLRPSFARATEGRYYEADADEALALAHPVLYRAFVLLGVILLFGAVIGFGLLAGVGLSLSSPWLILGYLGAFAFGVGLYSLAMAWVHQYMGHLPTALCTLLGALCMAVAILLAG